MLKHQADKPRYIPEKDEFLKYVIEDYADNDHWWNVRRFMWDVFGYSKNTSEGYEEVRSYITFGDGIRELGSILDSHNLIFDGEKQLQEFINLIMIAKNNTRIWENNGYTPSELHEIISKRNENIVNCKCQYQNVQFLESQNVQKLELIIATFFIFYNIHFSF